MTDPFDLLGIEPRFDLDLKAVEARHRDLSKALHPDRYVQAPAAERRMALSRAIEVNEAWRAVKDPIKRAEALLRKRGVPTGEIAQPPADPELLMEMMEAREELSEAARARDMKAVHRLSETMSQREREVLSALGRDFAETSTSDSAARKLTHHMGELRYLRRFLDEVAVILEAALL